MIGKAFLAVDTLDPVGRIPSRYDQTLIKAVQQDIATLTLLAASRPGSADVSPAYVLRQPRTGRGFDCG
jgi:hypothetical protein